MCHCMFHHNLYDMFNHNLQSQCFITIRNHMFHHSVTSHQGSHAVLKSWEKIFAIFPSGKVWKKVSWSVGMEKENYFPDLIF